MNLPLKSRLRLLLTLMCVAASLLTGTPAQGASAREERMFNAAADAFRDGFWDRAAREFGQFVERYPKSEFRAQAVLLQSQSLYKLGDVANAVRLLDENIYRAGELADDYLFWMAESDFQRRDYLRAAAGYSRLSSAYPDSDRCLESVLGEAICYYRMNRPEKVVEILTRPDSAFERALKSNAVNEFVVRGLLLLGETQLALTEYQAALQAVEPLLSQTLDALSLWRANQLRSRIFLEMGEPQAAWLVSTNLPSLATASRESRPQLLAESFGLQSQILEELRRYSDAIAVLQNNLAAGVPVEHQREALLKTAEYSLLEGKPDDARAILMRFLAENTNAPTADAVQMALGELDLKQHVAGIAVTVPGSTNNVQTNRLLRATQAFDELLHNYPDSSLAGRAVLGKAWCLWLGGDYTNSLSLFASATARLPFSEDQAVARFKWADAQMATGDFAGALTNYISLTEDYASISQVKTQLLETALYLSAQAATRSGNQAAASDAVTKLLEWFPAGISADRSVILVGQGMIERSDAVQARKMFGDFVQRWPDSLLVPQIQLLIARSYEQSGDWLAAAEKYHEWTTLFTNHPARAQAEFYSAWANYQAGREQVAFDQFTNVVALYPTNELAPAAQWWVADHAFRQSDFAGAERNYKVLFQTWPASPLAYEAKMMAGRAALARAQYAEAVGHFTNLTSDLNCPANLKIQALFAYGDALVQEASADTNKFANFEEAIRVYAKIPQLNSTNAQAGLAWGLIGNCYLQVGSGEAAAYLAATNAYAQAILLPASSVSTRSQAQVGIGLVLERLATTATPAGQQSLLRQALDNYLSVVYKTNLREGEAHDDFWVKKAGLEAGRLVELSGQPEQAIKLYQRLSSLLPALRDNLEKRIARLTEQSEAAKN